MNSLVQYDLVVLGAGSGGLASAISAARAGLSVLLLEAADSIGGTAVRAGVTCWEPGVGGTGLPFDIYRRLSHIPQAVGIYSFGRHFDWQDDWYWPHAIHKVNFPGGEHLIDPASSYVDTLRRHPEPGVPMDEAFKRETWHGVIFEPQHYVRVVHDMLNETPHCDVRLNTTICKLQMDGPMITAASLSDGLTIFAANWIDATGQASLCALAGCQRLLGDDRKDRFNEPDAPEEPTATLNGTTLIYRIAPTNIEAIEPLEVEIPEACWWADEFPPISCVQYPNGDRNCNMLPTMEGGEYVSLSSEAAYEECLRRVKAHWHFVQTHFAEFRRYRMSWVAPAVGLREGPRVVCRRMLTEHDLLAGLSGQNDPDIIALADHALDVHGEGKRCGELSEPYGVPYRCLIPEGMDNLLVACRGAGFSSIAASSCRLSRTMLQLGQAAGTAVAIATQQGIDLSAVPADELRYRLREQHVQLSYPIPPELLSRIAST